MTTNESADRAQPSHNAYLLQVGAGALCFECDWEHEGASAFGHGLQHARETGHRGRVTILHEFGSNQDDEVIIVAKPDEADLVARMFGAPENRAALRQLVDSRIEAESDDA